jgi:hypothetical protein
MTHLVFEVQHFICTWLAFVDPIWLDVLSIVCRGWRASVITTGYGVRTRTFNILTVRMQRTTSFVVILGPSRELYVRVNRGSRVFAPGLKRVHTDRNGDCTYVRDTHTRYKRKYFRIRNGKVGLVH